MGRRAHCCRGGSAISGWDPDVKGGSGLLSVFVTPRCILLPSARDYYIAHVFTGV